MSRIDQVFGTLANRLIKKWTIGDVVFVRNTGDTYDAETGDIVINQVSIPVNAVITRLKPTELGGMYQQNDVKIIPDPQPIGDEPIMTTDWFEYKQNGVTIKAKVITATQYRGNHPVAFVVVARPQ